MSTELRKRRVPDVPVRVLRNGTWEEVSSRTLFARRTVVLFALPGAFTPICSSFHVPRYAELLDPLRAEGVDEVICLSVNDPWVMEAWQKEERAEGLTFLADGNGTFTEAMGMLIDRSDLAYGLRSRRYSMLVRDGEIEKLFLEEGPGDPYAVSDADTMLRHLGGQAPPDIALFVRPGCQHSARARAALGEAGLPWAEISVTPRVLKALPGPSSTPQVFIDGRHVGGADALITWLDTHAAAPA